MVDKRFILAFEDYDGWAIQDTTGEYSNDEDYIDWLSGQKAVDVMNHFAEENEQLKEEISIFEGKDAEHCQRWVGQIKKYVDEKKTNQPFACRDDALYPFAGFYNGR